MIAKLGFVICVLSLSILSAGCSSTLAEQELPTTDEVYLLRKKYPNTGSDMALLEGTLKLSNQCLVVEADYDAPHYTPVWPYGYGYRQVSDSIEIINSAGKVVARVGEHISVAGSGTDPKNEAELQQTLLWLEDNVLGSLNCPSPFWIM